MIPATVRRESVTIEATVYRWREEPPAGVNFYRLELFSGGNYRLFQNDEPYESGTFQMFEREVGKHRADLFLDDGENLFVGLEFDRLTGEMRFVEKEEVEDFLGY